MATDSVNSKIAYFSRWLRTYKEDYVTANDIDKESIKKKMMRLIFKIESLQKGVDYKEAVSSYKQPYKDKAIEEKLESSIEHYKEKYDISKLELLNAKYYNNACAYIQTNIDNPENLKKIIVVLFTAIPYMYDNRTIKIHTINYNDVKKIFIIKLLIPDFFVQISDTPTNEKDEIAQKLNSCLDIIYDYLNLLLPKYYFIMQRFIDK